MVVQSAGSWVAFATYLAYRAGGGSVPAAVMVRGIQLAFFLCALLLCLRAFSALLSDPFAPSSSESL